MYKKKSKQGSESRLEEGRERKQAGRRKGAKAGWKPALLY
jgi:hypothetical protein